MLCRLCFIKRHGNHQQECFPITYPDVEDFVTEIYSRLRVRNERIVSVLDDLFNFREHHPKIASSEFLGMITEACELLG